MFKAKRPYVNFVQWLTNAQLIDRFVIICEIIVHLLVNVQNIKRRTVYVLI